MAEVNVIKLDIYVRELNELTSKISAGKRSIDNQLQAVRSIWGDDISREYLAKYEQLSADINQFVIQSSKLQHNLNQKLMILRRYLNAR